jgi:hypothetical protein
MSSSIVNTNNAVVVRYCWIVDLMRKDAESILANSNREFVRIMGTVVAIHDIPREDLVLEPLFTPRLSSDPLLEGSHDPSHCKLMTLDDGTAIISIWTFQSMIEELVKLQSHQRDDTSGTFSGETKAGDCDLLGVTVDCIIKLCQTALHRRWFAETLIPLHKTLEEEQQHRWILLSHQQKHLHRTTSSNFPLTYSHDFGFPTRRPDTSKLYHLIHVHAKIQQNAHDRQQKKENKLLEKRRHLHAKRRRSATTNKLWHNSSSNHTQAETNASTLKNSSSNHDNTTAIKHAEENITGQLSYASISPYTSKRPLQHPLVLKGLTLDDLTCLMQQSQFSVQGMIQDLQMDGRVYRNSQGEYLPL